MRTNSDASRLDLALGTDRDKTNQDVKYTKLTYSSTIGKTFLDESSFPQEDQLGDFEFSQAYANWLTLIEMISEPGVELGWRAHHKRMVSD